MDRRAFVKWLAGAGIAAVGVPLLAACSPAPAAAPTSAPAPTAAAAPKPTTAAAAASAPSSSPAAAASAASSPAAASTAAPAAAAQSGLQLPTFVPFQGPKPDVPGAPNGLPPAYANFPSSLVTTVPNPPGKGGDVNVMTFTNAPPPPPVDQNPAWQAMNKAVNANLKVNAVAAPDYLTKLNTTIASGDLPDMFYASVIGTALQNMPDFLASQCADLTPFLSGDAIKDYPNLAAYPSFRWPFGVFSGHIYAVPAATIAGQALLAKGSVLEQAGLANGFTSADDFMKGAKALTKPGTQYALAGTGAGYNSWNPLGWFMQVFRVPNDWRNDGGKLTKDIETPEFKAAVAYVRSLWDAGVMNPDSPNMNLTQAAAGWYSGKHILWQNGYFSFNLAWDRAVNIDPNFKPRIVSIFGNDGGKGSHLLGTNSDSLTVFKKASSDRIKELLGILNYMVAPFGSQEYLQLNYGIKDSDFSFDSRGNPILTQTGQKDVTSFPVWKLSAPTPVLFDANAPDFAQVASDAWSAALAIGVASPVVGLYSPTQSQKGAVLNQKLTDGLNGIVFGRDPVSNVDQIVQDWRSAGGDQVRAELQQALQNSTR